MPDLNPGSEFAGYTIEDIAGRGGMGVVYRARQHRPSRLVALKVIAPDLASDDSFRERFENESNIAASIEHPNVIPVYEVNEVDGAVFITMRFVEGTDLRALIAEKGRLEPELAAGVVAQIASALDAAHERGLVHRDIKPANVLIAGREGSYHAYLTDFGLTKSTQSESGMTKTGMFVGTLDDIAPEQLMGGPLDARADVYALGCLLYQALTGRVPFPAESGMAKMYAHGNEPPPKPTAAVPTLPPQFDDVVARAMAKDPNERYLSAGDLGRAARAAAESQSLTRAERSVATGDAAPAGATAVAPAPETSAGHTPATTAADRPTSAGTQTIAPPAGGNRNRLLAIGGGVLALVVIAVVALLALGGGGGGGDEAPRLAKDDYEDQVSDILREVTITATGVTVPQELPNIGDERIKIADDLDTVETAYSDAAAQLEDIRPPADVQDLHDQGVASIDELGAAIGDAQAAAETGDSEAYAAAFERYDAATDQVSQVTQQFADRGYERLGATPGNQTGRALTGEEREVADTIANAQRGYREGDVETYCLSRSTKWLKQAYGGRYPYETCVQAGEDGLQAEIPELLSGGDLSITDVAIEGDVAIVTATGDDDQGVVAEVTKNPPSDDVWRVNAFDTSLSGGP